MAIRPFRIVGRSDYRPYMTFGILVLNILFFVWEIFVTSSQGQPIEQLYDHYALVTCTIGQIPVSEIFIDGFRSLFLHMTFLELLTNMTFLWVFASPVEQFLGHRRFLAFYIAVGFGGHLASIAFSGGECAALIGSSGAIAGVLGAFLLLYPARRIEATIPMLDKGFDMPAAVYVFIYLSAAFLMDEGGPLSGTLAPFWDEIGGFISGFVILFVVTMFKSAPKVNPFPTLDDED